MNSLIGIILFISMLFSGTLYGNNVTVSKSHIQSAYVYDEGFEYEEEYVDYDNNSDDYNYDYDYDYNSEYDNYDYNLDDYNYDYDYDYNSEYDDYDYNLDDYNYYYDYDYNSEYDDYDYNSDDYNYDYDYDYNSEYDGYDYNLDDYNYDYDYDYNPEYGDYDYNLDNYDYDYDYNSEYDNYDYNLDDYNYDYDYDYNSEYDNYDYNLDDYNNDYDSDYNSEYDNYDYNLDNYNYDYDYDYNSEYDNYDYNLDDYNNDYDSDYNSEYDDYDYDYSSDVIDADSTVGDPYLGYHGSPWLNSNIYGNWPSERPELYDNFELSVNYDLYMNAKEHEITQDNYYSHAEEHERELIEKVLKDETLTSDELEIMREMSGLFYRMEEENGLSDNYFMGYVEKIRSAKDIASLSTLIFSGNLFGDQFISVGLNKAETDSQPIYTVAVSPDFSLYESDTDYLMTLLQYAGYPDYEAFAALERIREIISYCSDGTDGVEDEDPELYSLYEIYKMCKPLFWYISGINYYDRKNPDFKFDVYYSNVFVKLNELYSNDNLEAFKAMMIIPMVSYALPYVEPGYYSDTSDFVWDYITCQNIPGVAESVFINYCFPNNITSDVRELCERYITAAQNRVKGNSRIFESTKNNLTEELENVEVVVIYPEIHLDLKRLLSEIKSSDCLLEAVLRVRKYYLDYCGAFVGKEYNRGNPVIDYYDTFTPNAYYLPDSNVVFITLGVLLEGTEDMDNLEYIFAGIGTTVAHEIVHLINQSESESENEIRMKATEGITDRLSDIMLLYDGMYVDGASVLDEVMADLGGVALTLDLAGEIDDFDYDKFFRYYARQWYEINPDAESFRSIYADDEHPAPYVRVNYVLQQFDKFYETYPLITEGTLMYYAPEERESGF